MKLDQEQGLRALAALKDNAHFGHYVKMLEAKRDDAVTRLLYDDHRDEALRGEARSYDQLIKQIKKATP